MINIIFLSTCAHTIIKWFGNLFIFIDPFLKDFLSYLVSLIMFAFNDLYLSIGIFSVLFYTIYFLYLFHMYTKISLLFLNYHYRCDHLYNIICEYNVKKATFPCFLGTGLMILVGNVSLTNESFPFVYQGENLKIDEISFAQTQVNKIIDYFKILKDTELDEKIKFDRRERFGYWNNEKLPIFEAHKQEILAIQKDSLDKKSFKIKLQTSEDHTYTLDGAVGVSNNTPISTIVKLIGEKQVNGIKIYFHESGSFGNIKYVRGNNIENKCWAFDFNKFHNANISNTLINLSYAEYINEYGKKALQNESADLSVQEIIRPNQR